MQREQLRKSRCFTSLLLPILPMFLSACVAYPTGDDDKGIGQQAFSTINKKSELMIGDDAASMLELAKDVLKDEAKLRGRILPYSDDPGDKTKKLGQLIREVRKRNKDTSKGTMPFKGLGGGYYHTFLNAAELNIDPATDGYTNLEANPELWGRITDFEFTRKSNTDTGSGEMKVATIETYKLGDIIVGMNTFLWEIKINGNAYVIHEIQGGNDPDPATWTDSDWAAWDPFPNTLFFSIDMKKRIHDKGFDVKLHARGTKINVTKLTVNGHVVTGSDKDYWPLTLPDKENCIDIFFALGDEDGDGQPDLDKIPTEYQQLTEHAYCLGRCKGPAIVNSR